MTKKHGAPVVTTQYAFDKLAEGRKRRRTKQPSQLSPRIREILERTRLARSGAQ